MRGVLFLRLAGSWVEFGGLVSAMVVLAAGVETA